VHEFRGDGFGVALDGELGAAGVGESGEVEGVVEGLEERGPQFRSEKAGGSSADENGGEWAGVWSEGAEFIPKALGELALAVLRINDAVKIAVMALVEAEGDVDVEGAGRVGGGRRGWKLTKKIRNRKAGTLINERDSGIVWQVTATPGIVVPEGGAESSLCRDLQREVRTRKNAKRGMVA
jgi:hypothetical protein